MGNIFNIQRFSVHDGPGIRTTVFLKGCTLRCAWCHNPESIDPGLSPQFSEKSKLAGREATAEEVLSEVLKDIEYYNNSGGGMTISGGEPLLQADFTAEILKAAKDKKIHTALDTAANVPWQSFEKVLPFVDLVLLDLKIMDPELHKIYTGSDNKKILDNARKLFETGKEVNIRIPVVGGINDTVPNARLTAEFIKGYQNITEVKLLPYHSLGVDKAKTLGINQQEFVTPDREILEKMANEFECLVKF
jgi:pyruvate formate lyase activating enzyme